MLAVLGAGRLDVAVFAAFGSLASLYGHGEPARVRVGSQLAVAVALTATIAIATGFSAAQGPLWLLGVLLFALVLCAGALGAVLGWVPRGEIFFVLVFLVLSAIPATWGKAALGTFVGFASAIFSVGLAVLESRLADPGEAPRRLRQRIAAGTSKLDRRQHAISIAAAAIGVVLAWLTALALGIGHPFWAPVAVTAVMPALLTVRVRAKLANLLLGTLGGVALAGVFFSFDPDPLALIVMIIVCQSAAELFIARQYGVALLFLSPLAIGMSNLGRGLPWEPLLTERAIEAALGAAIGLVVIVVTRELTGTRLEPAEVKLR